MQEFSRLDRISEQVKQELNVIIQREVKDPRLSFMTSVNHVRVSKDLAYADVYVSFLDINTANEDMALKTDENLQILQKAAGFIRHSLGQKIQLRQIPELRFYQDMQLEQANRIDSLLKS